MFQRMCQNDNVLLAATSECDGRDPDFAFFVITLVCQALEGYSSHVDDGRLFEIWNEWEGQPVTKTASRLYYGA